jgi:hypothetical protein
MAYNRDLFCILHCIKQTKFLACKKPWLKHVLFCNKIHFSRISVISFNDRYPGWPRHDAACLVWMNSREGLGECGRGEPIGRHHGRDLHQSRRPRPRRSAFYYPRYTIYCATSYDWITCSWLGFIVRNHTYVRFDRFIVPLNNPS